MEWIESNGVAELRSTLRRVLQEEWRGMQIRRWWEGDNAASGKLNIALDSLGLPLLTLSNERGGIGVGDKGVLKICEDLGRSLVPGLRFETVAVAVPLLTESGFSGAPYLERVVSEGARVALAFSHYPYSIEADDADLLLRVEDNSVVIHERSEYSVVELLRQDRIRRVYTVHGLKQSGVELECASVSATRARARAIRGTASRLVGIAEELLARTVHYVGQRSQFGVQIGTFQVVRHRLADVFVAIRLARSAVYELGFAHIEDKDETRALANAQIAKILAAEAAELASHAALQFHGAIGFSWENDLQFWLKHGKTLEHEYGTTMQHLDALSQYCLIDTSLMPQG